LLGIFTVARLVETGLESMHYLVEIARIREFYRTLSAEAEQRFAPDRGRWPEAKTPALRLGPMLAFFGTTASMIAVINNLVAGAAVALLMHAISPSVSRSMDVAAGIVCALALTVAFYFYQRWRFTEFDGASPVNDQ
jgi:hypothetical protein